jgi:hypothetical protein
MTPTSMFYDHYNVNKLHTDNPILREMIYDFSWFTGDLMIAKGYVI